MHDLPSFSPRGGSAAPQVERPGTAAAHVFATLRDAIASLELRPGQSFSELEVARRLGVSRTPVREAVIRLADAGLVEVLPQRGTLVRLISAAAVADVRFVRQAIEVAVLREAVGRGLPAAFFDAARGLVAAQRDAADAGDLRGFLARDDAFHRAFADAAGRGHAWSVVEAQKAQMDRVRFLALSGVVPFARMIGQHEAILEAAARGDVAATEAALRVHLAENSVIIEPLRQRHPDLFEPDAT